LTRAWPPGLVKPSSFDGYLEIAKRLGQALACAA
jgi:hypothetical protein